MAAVTYAIRIGTWNLHEAVPADGELQGTETDEARREIVDLLVRYRLDVIGLQEVDFQTPSHSRTLDAITRSTPLKHTAYNVLSESSFYPKTEAGVAIASRYPLSGLTRRFLKNPDLTGEIDNMPIRMFDKGYVSAAITVAKSLLRFASLHAFPFHLFERDAEEAAFQPIWTDLSADLAKLATAPLIVCGDFNTDRRDLLLDGHELPLSRAIAGKATCEGESLDDMLFTSDFELGDVSVVDNFSDHRLCFAEVIFRAEKV